MFNAGFTCSRDDQFFYGLKKKKNMFYIPTDDGYSCCGQLRITVEYPSIKKLFKNNNYSKSRQSIMIPTRYNIIILKTKKKSIYSNV